MVKDDRAFDIEGPIVGNAGIRLPKKHLECRLALLERPTADVLQIQQQQIEGAERGEVVVMAVAQ